MEKQYVKALIELATSFEVADDVMNQYSGCNSDEERIHYLTELFDCKIIGNSVKDVHSDYVALLTSIVGQKWRG